MGKEMTEIIASIGFIVLIYLFVIGMMILWDKEK
jgi:cytochrome c1